MSRTKITAFVAMLMSLALPGVARAERAATGWVDAIEPGGIVVGWAIDPDYPTASLDVNLYSDGRWAGACETRTARPDVNAYLSLPGNPGFRCHLRHWALDGQPHRITVKALDHDGPRAVNERATIILETYVTILNRRPFGWIDVRNGHQVTGWAFDPDVPHVPLTVTVAAGDFTRSQRPCFMRTTTGGPRQDVNNHFQVPGNPGFSVALNENCQAAVAAGHRPYVYVYDGQGNGDLVSELLPGS